MNYYFLALRRNRCLALILLGLGLLSSSGAHAQKMEAALSTGYIGYSKNSSQIEIGPSLGYQAFGGMQWLQLFGEITFQKLSERGGSTRSTLFLGGPLFNLSGANLADAFFISIGLAYKSGSSDVVDASSEDPYGVGFYLLFGKRITLGGAWSLRPSVGMVSTGSSGLVFRPLSVSYRF